MKLLSFWGKESNPYANPRFANNGGGYSQPKGGAFIELSGGQLALAEYHDINQGDFGRKRVVSVEVDGKTWKFMFGEDVNQSYSFYNAAPEFRETTGEDLGEITDLVIDATLTAMEIANNAYFRRSRQNARKSSKQ